MCEFKRNRSNFYLKIRNNTNCINLYANEMVMHLLNIIARELVDSSPIGWSESRNYSYLYNLWIPNDKLDKELLQDVIDWCEYANSYIWLSTNKNTRDFFDGNEIDFCLALDWNYDLYKKNRTPLGEAEYQLKYQLPKGYLETNDAKKFKKALKTALYSSIECLPFDIQDFLVTTIPAVEEKQDKLSWKMAEWVSKKYNIDFLKATLSITKPQMKEQKVENKIQIWREIYREPSNIYLSHNITGRNILIVDDLYQSGASIWCYAEMLKSLKANVVIAVTSVKSLRDGDNT